MSQITNIQSDNFNKVKLFKIFCLISITLVFIISDSFRLFSYKSALGIDGYFYVLQVESLLNTGRLYYFSPTPLILYFLAAVSLIVGNTIIGIKIGIIFLQCSLYLSVFSFTKSLTNFRLGILALAICGISSLHVYLIVEYVNYLGAISFFLWACFFISVFIRNRRKLFLVGAVISLLIALGSHISMVGIIPLTFLIIILIRLLWKAVNLGNLRHTVFYLAALSLLFFSPLLLVLQPFFSIPRSWQNEISFIPVLPANPSTFSEMLILLISTLIFIATIIFLKKDAKNNTRIVFWGVCSAWSILVTLNPFVVSDLVFTSISGRIRLLAFIQLAVLVPGIIWLLKDKFSYIHWYVSALIIPFMIWSFFNPLPRGAQSDYLARRARLAESLEINFQEIDPQSIVIAEHGEQFVVTAVTNIPSQQNFPKDNKYSTVYWLLNLVPPTLIDPSMKIISKDNVGFYTVLIKDNEIRERKLQNLTARTILRNSNRHLNNYLIENNIP